MQQVYLVGEKLYPGNGKRRRSSSSSAKKNQESEYMNIIPGKSVSFLDAFITWRRG